MHACSKEWVVAHLKVDLLWFRCFDKTTNYFDQIN